MTKPFDVTPNCHVLAGRQDVWRYGFPSTPNAYGKETISMNTIENFINDETGLELSEYAVAAALIAVAVAAAFTDLGTAIKGAIDSLKGKITAS